MTFQPYVPIGGISGWRFLQDTLATQREAHAKSPVQQRDLNYFRQNIAKVDTAEALVADYRLLSVALGAFGLQDDIGSKFLIRRVLAEGTAAPDALANRLSDKRYRDLSNAFGFGDFPTPNSKTPQFADRIESLYRMQLFEADMGNTNETMRLALNAQRELPALAQGAGSNRTKWFTLMGTPPMRKVMETALALPPSFATLPIDRQLDTFLERAQTAFGTNRIDELGSNPILETVLNRYTAIDGLTNGGGSNVSSPALVLLRGF